MSVRSFCTALAVTALIAGLPQPASAASGKDLYTKNGCVACHGLAATDAKKMGPNFSAIAAKFTAKDADKLAKKIRSGGSGSFGTIPMPPMPQVSEADAKELVKFVLSYGAAAPAKNDKKKADGKKDTPKKGK